MSNHFAHHHFQDHGLSDARIIHATITKMKHTINTRVITIFVNAHIILGNACVEFVCSSPVSIQSQIIGKHVFNLIQLHSHPHSTAWTEFCHNHQKPSSTAKNHPTKYDNTLFFINFGIKK